MNTKQKISIISGLILLALTLIIFFAVRPIFLEIQKVSSMISQSRDKLLLIEKTDQDYFKQIESDYEEITSNIAIIKSGLIDENQAVGFFMDLEKTASLTFNKLEINASNFPVLDLALIGSFPDLMRFLGWLEKGKYFLDVESLDIKQTSERETLLGFSSGDVRTSLKVKVYTKK
ncbi:MAG: hypothetical protein A2V69_02780 [Candidatus Portnoybacteria bacterium RBG_13_40_8]|uniref:Type 4a pilus biogenesis protein PilO n=1 Tax=Candidatus Portnoybacteria bacterium RBG_13_40_8 TaxID=1801990 RepID=A0A1G2F542_9BACT|nr:MAG: hypothetical protein A2V69_02780 [Candidatus Portnoybacteria bacterium RBG_13_40_8]OGZ35443.1 MAG: hypothetical protein A2V60_03330 [Candidatus Portnoybacteria bacterium RIFCSPHIGHO2_01_FULL_39_19]